MQVECIETTPNDYAAEVDTSGTSRWWGLAFGIVCANCSAGEWSLKRLSIVLNEILSTKQGVKQVEYIETTLNDYATWAARSGTSR